MIAAQSLTQFDDYRLAPGCAGTTRHDTMIAAQSLTQFDRYRLAPTFGGTADIIQGLLRNH